ncbi:MAG: TonB-dependent receptor, partial [Mucilaginibacter sp.]|nr:TonB-dependent receptor [Mucilaginibacter sp.]
MECFCPKIHITMKLPIIKIYFTLLLLLISAATLFAQTVNSPATVSGALLNEQGKPLDYATVSLLKAQDSSMVKGTLSSQSGTYAFEHIKPGSYIIKATVVGYEKSVSKPFTLTETSPNVTIPALMMK